MPTNRHDGDPQGDGGMRDVDPRQHARIAGLDIPPLSGSCAEPESATLTSITIIMEMEMPCYPKLA